jgi:uncharacterized protein YcfJ
MPFVRQFSRSAISDKCGCRRMSVDSAAAGPLGAVAGTIPGAIIGGIIGALVGNKIGSECDRAGGK